MRPECPCLFTSRPPDCRATETRVVPAPRGEDYLLLAPRRLPRDSVPRPVPGDPRRPPVPPPRCVLRRPAGGRASRVSDLFQPEGRIALRRTSPPGAILPPAPVKLA